MRTGRRAVADRRADCCLAQRYDASRPDGARSICPTSRSVGRTRSVGTMPGVALRRRCPARAFLDTVTSVPGAISAPMRGTTPTSYRERTCARAPAHVRAGHMVNALGFQGMCYRVTGHLRARQVLGKTAFLDDVTLASPGHESTWTVLTNQEKPSNKSSRRKAL